MTVTILHLVQQLWPSQFQWLNPPYEYETNKPPIDIISGTDLLRQQLGSCKKQTIGKLVLPSIKPWHARIENVLLYGSIADRFVA